MKQGDFVKIIGRDGFYLFLKEVQGIATLREGSAPRFSKMTKERRRLQFMRRPAPSGTLLPVNVNT
jgi:hypothetical protein